MDDPSAQLIDECRRQEESCLYTSTALFEWVKVLRRWKIFFVVAPIVLAGLATGLPTDLRPGLGWLIGTCTLLAGIATAVYKALDLDVSLEVISKQANQFKVLQDGFRQAWRIRASVGIDDLRDRFDALMEQLNALRLSSLPPPERYFRKAQAKVKSGDYDFSADISNGKPGFSIGLPPSSSPPNEPPG
jgi:hypothetical protein